MLDRRGIILIDLLMEGVAVMGVLAMVAIGGLQLSRAVTGVAETREHAIYDALRRDLQELKARQTLHYADELSYSASPEALGFASSAEAAVTIEASGWGWSAAVTHPRLDADEGCAIFIGHALPPVEPVTPPQPGEVACTD